MIEKTLLVSNSVNNHEYYRKRLGELGFPKASVTALTRDALDMLIEELKPDLVMMGARFYECSTPFLMGELKKRFPDTFMAALSIGPQYPPDLAMKFITNKINSWVTSYDGIKQFYDGLDEVRKGRVYISPGAKQSIAKRGLYPMPAGRITDRHKEIILLICNGFKDIEIAETLYITRRTVTTHKTEIFTALNVRSPNELIRVALNLDIVGQDGMYFYPKGFTVNPLPDEKLGGRK